MSTFTLIANFLVLRALTVDADDLLSFAVVVSAFKPDG